MKQFGLFLVMALVLAGACSGIHPSGEPSRYPEIAGVWESSDELMPHRLIISVHDGDKVSTPIYRRYFRKFWGTKWYTDGAAWGTFTGTRLLLDIRWNGGRETKMYFYYLPKEQSLCNPTRCLKRVA